MTCGDAYGTTARGVGKKALRLRVRRLLRTSDFGRLCLGVNAPQKGYRGVGPIGRFWGGLYFPLFRLQ